MPKEILGRMWRSKRSGWVSFCLLTVSLVGSAEFSAWAASPGKTTAHGNADVGRSIFNGKGVCYYCHGVDGDLQKPPQLNADTAALITRLNPPPADLRNPKALHLKTDKQRTHAIREGHPGTGMFPDTTMTNQELADTLAYLARLRRGDQ